MTTPLEQRLKQNPGAIVSLHDVFSELKELETPGRRAEFLMMFHDSNEHNRTLMQSYVECLYHPMIVLELPDEIPPYRVNDNQYEDYISLKLGKAFKRIPHFVKGHNDFIENNIKRESVFIKTLEELHKDEAELFASLLLRKVDTKKYPGLTDELLITTFKQYLPEGYVHDTKKQCTIL